MHPAKVRRIAVAIGAVLIVCGGGAPSLSGTGSTATPVATRTVEMLQWSLKEQMDARPGAVVVDLTGDGNRLWFVTREGSRVYRFDLRGGKKVNKADWFSFQLDPMATGTANGIRRIKTSGDKRSVFVDSTVSLQRVDTGNCTTTYVPEYSVTCPRTTWMYEATTPPDATMIHPFHGSDVAIDEQNDNVYTAVAAVDPETFLPLPTGSFVQRLDPNTRPSKVTRWYVGHGAGMCPTSNENPCLSGIAIDRRNRDFVYYSEPGSVSFDDVGTPIIDSGAIAELDTRYNKVRRWRMADLAAKSGDGTIREPRQLYFDNDGTLWAVTGSGHLVSLDPKKSRMSKHMVPPEALADPFGVSPDGGLIGYTDPGQIQPRVGMLMPERRSVFVAPVNDEVPSLKFTIDGGDPQPAETSSGQTPAERLTVPARVVRNQDGTFSEALTMGTVETPLGITPDRSARVGTFFFAIGDFSDFGSINRIGRVRLPRNEMRGRVERDDDDDDDDGKRHDVDDDDDDDGTKDGFDADNDNDGTPDVMDDDDDDDGIEDSFDTKDRKESKQTSQQDVPGGQAGEDPFVVNPDTLLVVASASAPDPLSLVRVEIVNAAGTIVASSLDTPGSAVVTFVPPATGGAYTLRARNGSLTSRAISTKILTRALWPLGL